MFSRIKTQSRPIHPNAIISQNQRTTTRVTHRRRRQPQLSQRLSKLGARKRFPVPLRNRERRVSVTHQPSTRCAHLGKCWANDTVSTSRLNVCAATNSATSRSAVDGRDQPTWVTWMTMQGKHERRETITYSNRSAASSHTASPRSQALSGAACP
jgi:hypothetical protein